ncbi:hypothetical protein NQ317_011107 [Molorchus minor]|uniref:Uncharacterized protein n=1 Tax=Molorchus minor TaxID=1323400 RepID=A0ABQ9K0R2_9CUCU|nr:hypothetical protein NQ317_011107 [Molorchus minor]
MQVDFIATNTDRNTERETVGEWENPLYQAVRENRLTASNCGTVIKRRSSTKPDNLVKNHTGNKLCAI